MMKLMKLAALALLAPLANAQQSVVEENPEICQEFQLIVDSYAFSWKDPVGGFGISNSGGDIRWGIPADRTLGQSGLTAVPNPLAPDLEPGKQTKLGSLKHLNFPILNGGHVSQVTLVVDIKTNHGDFQFLYLIDVDETPNVAGTCDYPGEVNCADKVIIIDHPEPLHRVTMSGIEFSVELTGFRKNSQTSETTDYFISDELKENEAHLYGTVKIEDCPGDPGSDGDPHFHTWTGQWYDFQGACDLHLLTAPKFVNDMDLTIDIRTKIRYAYSYIESVAVKIGNDILEVSSYGVNHLNGVDNVDFHNEGAKLGGLAVHYSQPDMDEKQHKFEIFLSKTEKITIKTFKDMVNVAVHDVDRARFGATSGMMGDSDNGLVYTRDGHTILEDPLKIAREWQVRNTEPMLFTVVDGPQYPQECAMPDPTRNQRKLGRKIAVDAATKACASWPAARREGCVKDVMATGDLDLASAGP